jgi:hypothetical protein
MGKRKWVFAGLVVSAAILAVILWRLDWEVFVAEIRAVDYRRLLAVPALIALSAALRALRWNVAAGAPVAAYGSFWRASVIGLALNHIYPLRAGEIFRIFMLMHVAAVPFGRSAASAFVDRLADVLLLGLCALVVAAAHTGVAYAEKLAWATLALGCIAVFAMILFVKGDRTWRRWSMRLSASLPRAVRERLQRFYVGAVETSALVASPSRLARIAALTAAAYALDYAAVLSAMDAFGWRLPTIAPLTVLVFLALATSLPSAPGYVGVFQLAFVLALALFGIAESSALAFSIVFQLCVLAAVVPLAALALAGRREELKSARSALAQEKPPMSG